MAPTCTGILNREHGRCRGNLHLCDGTCESGPTKFSEVVRFETPSIISHFVAQAPFCMTQNVDPPSRSPRAGFLRLSRTTNNPSNLASDIQFTSDRQLPPHLHRGMSLFRRSTLLSFSSGIPIDSIRDRVAHFFTRSRQTRSILT